MNSNVKQFPLKTTNFVPTIYLDEGTENALKDGALILQRGQWLVRDIEQGRFNIKRRQKGRFIGVFNHWNRKERRHEKKVYASWRKPGETLEEWNKRHSFACQTSDNKNKKRVEPSNPPLPTSDYEFGYEDYTEENNNNTKQHKPIPKGEYVMITKAQAKVVQFLMVVMTLLTVFTLIFGG